MFHQLLIRPEDQNAQCFLERYGGTGWDPDIYVMQAMIFVAMCYPHTALYVINVNAKSVLGKYPEASKELFVLFWF